VQHINATKSTKLHKKVHFFEKKFGGLKFKVYLCSAKQKEDYYTVQNYISSVY